MTRDRRRRRTRDLGRVPPAVTTSGNLAVRFFRSFLATQIHSDNTRDAYSRAIYAFFAVTEGTFTSLDQITPGSVSEYVKELGRTRSGATVNQHLAALQKLFDWFVGAAVIPFNPVSSVARSTERSASRSRATLSIAQTRAILDSIDTSNLAGLRDRAILSLMVHALLTVSSVVSLDIGHYRSVGRRRWLDVPSGDESRAVLVGRQLAHDLDRYIDAAKIRNERMRPLIRSLTGRSGELTERRVSRVDILRIVKRRAQACGISSAISCRALRETGIRVFLANGGAITTAQQVLGVKSVKAVAEYLTEASAPTVKDMDRIAV